MRKFKKPLKLPTNRSSSHRHRRQIQLVFLASLCFECEGGDFESGNGGRTRAKVRDRGRLQIWWIHGRLEIWRIHGRRQIWRIRGRRQIWRIRSHRQVRWKLMNSSRMFRKRMTKAAIANLDGEKYWPVWKPKLGEGRSENKNC